MPSLGRPLLSAPNGLRVRTVGPHTSPLSGDVSLLPDEGMLRPEGPHGTQHVDALLLDDAAEPDDVEPLLGEAAEHDVTVLDYRETADAPVRSGDVVEVGPAATGGPWPFPVVDPARVNPIGFRRAARQDVGFGSLRPVPDDPRVTAELEQLLHRTPLTLNDVRNAAALPPAADGSLPLLDRLRPLAGALDHPDLHPDPETHAAWLVTVTAGGVPVVLARELPDATRQRLHPALADTLPVGGARALADLDDRERLSVLQRCTSLREHGSHRAWQAIADQAGLLVAPPPSVSVLLATNRPEHLAHAAAQHERLDHPDRELVAVLHGDRFTDADEAGFRDRVTTPLTVLRAPEEAVLGEVMQLATSAASGELVTKMDDDDLYDRDHLTDLITALRYSGATVVAKGSEFVYLAELDITIRRMPNGVETGSRSVAGGTLLMARDDVRRIGGWQRVPRSIDQLLIGDTLAAGGSFHRTHGHGFVLNRHGKGHTWASSVDRFLQHAVNQWPGLALAEAGFSDTSLTLP